jgi:hypothetical protein
MTVHLGGGGHGASGRATGCLARGAPWSCYHRSSGGDNLCDEVSYNSTAVANVITITLMLSRNEKGTHGKWMFNMGRWRIVSLVPSSRKWRWPEMCSGCTEFHLTKYSMDQRFNMVALSRIATTKHALCWIGYSWSEVAIQVTRSHPSRLLFVGIRAEYGVPTECKINRNWGKAS